MLLERILILLVILVIKSIFSAGDTALTYINRAKITQLAKTDKKAKKIKALMSNKNKFYSLIEVGITMIELFASAYAAETFVKDLAIVLEASMDYNIAIVLSLIIVTLVLSYFLLLFGAILPKRIARNNPQKTAYRIISILYPIAVLNVPFEKIINGSARFLEKLFNMPKEPEEKLTEKEIKMIIMEGKEEGVIEKSESEIMINTLKFDETPVKKVMVAIENADMINITDDFDKVLEKIRKHNYSRIPVFKAKKDNIIGILHSKDLLIHYIDTKQMEIDISEKLRTPIRVNEDEPIATTFQTMKDNNIAMVVVVNKDGKNIGIVTMEDILEELVGNVLDEYDKK